ncbi:Vir protein [Legionella sp. CNM-1927-20]|uniref:Vir protein n=1 Tax=Legionella sp. CNM-1927-20 TaxID=3422221 RepID=UPI00403B0013
MSSPSTATDDQDKRIDALFARLGAIYGHIWWSNFKSEKSLQISRKEWSSGLKRFDNLTLKEALLTFRERHPFPPSLPQFIECCKSISNRKIVRKPKEETIKRALIEVAEFNIKAMLGILKR